MQLHIKLRDGFRDDTVTVQVNDRQVFHRSNVRTDLAISYADGVDVDVVGDLARVQISVEGGPSASKAVRPAETAFVDVWIDDAGRMELRESPAEVPLM